MKKICFSFITLMMVAIQSFAGPLDSLTTVLPGYRPLVDQERRTAVDPERLTFVEGENPLVNEEPLDVEPDGTVDFNGYILSGDGLSTTATQSCTTSSTQALGSTRYYTFTFRTYSTHTPALLVDNSGMFKMTTRKLNSGNDKFYPSSG